MPKEEELGDGEEDATIRGDALDDGAGVGGCKRMRGELLGIESDSSDALRGGDELPGVEAALDLFAFSRACTHLGCGLFFSCERKGQERHITKWAIEIPTSRMTLSSSATRFCRRDFSSDTSFLMNSTQYWDCPDNSDRKAPLTGVINFIDT